MYWRRRWKERSAQCRPFAFRRCDCRGDVPQALHKVSTSTFCERYCHCRRRPYHHFGVGWTAAGVDEELCDEKRGETGCGCWCVCWSDAVHPSNAAALNTMGDVGDAIQACWTPPADAGTASVTLSFSFKRDGTLIGPPRPTAIKVDGDAKAKEVICRRRGNGPAELPAAELLAEAGARRRRQRLHAAVRLAQAIAAKPHTRRTIGGTHGSRRACRAQWCLRLASACRAGPASRRRSRPRRIPESARPDSIPATGFARH